MPLLTVAIESHAYRWLAVEGLVFFIKIIVTFCTGISLPLKLFNSGKLFEVVTVFLFHKKRVFQKAFSQIYALVIFKYVAYHSDLEKENFKIVLAVAAS